MANYNIRELQLRILGILLEFDKVCKEHGLRYCICGGTMIGAVRHKGFIPWDDDLDVSMPRPDYEKLIAHCHEWLPKQFEFVCAENDPNYPLPFGKIQDASTTLIERKHLYYLGGCYIDIFPYSERKTTATNRMYELQDKLVLKEYLNAKLYFNLGTYFGNCIGSGGNNYEACIITSQNALKDYPYTTLREQFASLIMQSKYELAIHSVKEKQAERFQDAEDECYGFMNEYPDSKDIALAEKYIDKCKKFSAGKLTFD